MLVYSGSLTKITSKPVDKYSGSFNDSASSSVLPSRSRTTFVPPGPFLAALDFFRGGEEADEERLFDVEEGF